jgi:hypothetical protein
MSTPKQIAVEDVAAVLAEEIAMGLRLWEIMERDGDRDAGLRAQAGIRELENVGKRLGITECGKPLQWPDYTSAAYCWRCCSRRLED